MRLPDWRNTSRSFALVYLLTICSLQFSPLVSYAQNLGTAATEGRLYKVKPRPNPKEQFSIS